MNFPRREELLETFEDVAELYDRARPRYPQDLFDDVFEITGLVPPARLLEIGSGTGIATAVIAERGFGVVGIELGASMAYVARQNLEGSPTVEIITGTFETYEQGGTFDAVVAFSAFHWIDPDVRYQKAASLVRESGFLVVADARLVPGDADRFFLEVDEDYEIVLGERANEEGAPGLTSLRDEMEESGLFRHVAERRYRWHVTYTDTSYVELLDSFPWYRALDPSQRADLYARIRQRIQKRPTQTVTATFDAVLDVARRTTADVTRRGGTLAASGSWGQVLQRNTLASRRFDHRAASCRSHPSNGRIESVERATSRTVTTELFPVAVAVQDLTHGPARRRARR